MRLERFRTPGPPEDLRRRVLAAAARALDDEAPAGIFERLWMNRPLRVAWVLTTFGLLFAHAALSLGPGAPSVAESKEEADELREVLALPEVEISPRAESITMGESSKTNENEVKS